MSDLLQEFGFPDLMSSPATTAQAATGTTTVPMPRPRPALEDAYHVMKDTGFMPDESKQQQSSDEGFWSLAGRSLLQSAIQATQETGAGAGAAFAPGGVQQMAQALPEPDANDEITKLNRTPISEGWTNSRWWGAKIGTALGSSAPSAALGAGGAMVGGSVAGPPGAVVGGAGGAGIGMALQSFVPAYKVARAQGLDHDKAYAQALEVSGISGAFGAAMGIVPGMNLTGQTVTGALKRPITEALVKLGLAEPGLLLAQQGAVKAAQSPTGSATLTPDEALEGYITGFGLGAALHTPYALLERARNPSTATEEGIKRGFSVTQEPDPDMPEVHAPMWSRMPDFYEKVSKTVDGYGGNSLEPHEWMDILKYAHPSAENIELPMWIAGDDGKVAKRDLLAYVESKGIKTDYYDAGNNVTEVTFREPTGKTTNFGQARYTFVDDSEGRRTMLVSLGNIVPGRKGAMRGEEADIIANHLSLLAVNNNAERITWQTGTVRGGLPEAFEHLADMHGMQRGKTPVWSTLGHPLDYVQISPINASNIRQGYYLFNQKPGTYLNEDPFGAGKRALSNQLDQFAQAGRGNAWVQVPEGGQGVYMRLTPHPKPEDKYLQIANVDFDRKGTGAYGHYLQHLEGEAQRRGWKGVQLENVENQRLIPFYEKRGYTRDQNQFDLSPYPSYRKDFPRGEEAVNPPGWGTVGGGGYQAPAVTGKFSHPSGGKTFPTAGSAILTPQQLRPSAKLISKAIETLRKAMGMKAPVVINIHDAPHPTGGRFGDAGRTAHGYEINLYLPEFDKVGAEGLWATAAHEFGHVVMWHFFDHSSMTIKNAIEQAHRAWRAELGGDPSFNDHAMRRYNAVKMYYGTYWQDPDFNMLSMTPERQRYFLGFEEWFAEQVARWATTSAKPLSIVDRFFSSLGRRVLQVVGAFRDGMEKLGLRPSAFSSPTRAVKDWLDSFVNNPQPFAADIYSAAMLRSTRKNQKAFNDADEGAINAVPQTGSTGGARGLISRVLGGNGPNPAAAAGADRFNKFYEWMISLPQLAKLNPHIDGLQRYRELVSMLHLEKVNMMNEAETTLHLWRNLQTRQGDAVAGLIDDYMNMTYRTPAEVAQKISRRPTQADFRDMVRKNGVNDKGIAVFQRVVQDFDRMLDRYQMLLEQGAHQIQDPVVSAQKLSDIADQIAQIRKAPYFPAMRFGNYTLTVRDNADKVVHFETFENANAQRAAADIAQRQFPQDHTVRVGYLRKDQAPFVGLPPGLLDKIGEKLSLSQSQREAIDQLRFEYMPAQSFAHRFQRKKDVPGYSQDFIRAYASYMFHGSNYFTRIKYADSLREAIKDTQEASVGMLDAVKRDQITNYMRGHFDMLMDPKPDFATLRSLMFHWALGFNPAAATLNLSQTVLGTYPYLASKFGSDARAIAAMAKASSKFSTFYSKMSIASTTEPEMKGIAEAVKQGLISETQANVLAATADGRVLSQRYGGNRMEKLFNTFSRGSQFFFEMTEQVNRRVAFRAAWDMAMADPGNPHVTQQVRENQILYDSLRLKGFTDQEARAYVTAKDAVESTQYVYAPWARPKFMTKVPLGKTLFMFKSFTQNTLFYLWNNPGAAARMLPMLVAAGGIMGLPGAEDANGIAKALAYHLFGKDFDLEDEVRQFVTSVLHGGGGVDRPGDIRTSEGGIRPDILLHGLSRVGYGIPAVMDMLGSIAGMGHIPMPVIDRHANLSMGNILPFEPGQVLAPQVTGPGAGAQNLDSTIARQTQRASGAVFGVGFALYRALESSLTSGWELKKWEQAMPTALRNANQAFRYYNEGKAKNAQGAALVRFDPNEPEHAMEILGQALGYRPERLSAAWDHRTAEREAEAFWDLRRQYLMSSAWTAKQSSDPQVYKSVQESIRKFNRDLPTEARGKAITSDALRQSFQTKARATAKTEMGVPQARSNVPLSRSVQKLYPESRPAGRAGYPPQGGALGK